MATDVYRPKDLAQGGYCHPILVWANGHTDNPEPNPPLCLTGNGQYCGSYLMLVNQLASHGFVVIASPKFANSIMNQLGEEGVTARVIGEVRDGEPGVEFV